MNAKQVKKLKDLTALYYQLQPPDMPNRQSLTQIYKSLKEIHKTKPNDRTIPRNTPTT